MRITVGADTRTQPDLSAVRQAQRAWAKVPVNVRLRLVRAFRHDIAQSAEELASAAVRESGYGENRESSSLAERLSSEVLPLAEACRFLEREAEFLLAPRREPNRLRPFWLSGVTVETRREPLGILLIVGPGNYPLFLPGSQALQALVAGNAVLWKPAMGGRAAAEAVRRLLVSNGLDPQLLIVLDEYPEDAIEAMRKGVDKVVLTGSAETGRNVMHELAEHLTPSVMELSGCDAVFVLEGADLARVAEAVAFGLRLNGSATCMAPRRLFTTAQIQHELLPLLTRQLRHMKPVEISPQTHKMLGDLTAEATLYGAKLALNGLNTGNSDRCTVTATLISDALPSMRITQTDIFAPVLSIITVKDEEEALRMHEECPYALTAAVFGPRRAAESLASRINAGTVLVNDVIVSTADPRVSFGGRRMSGFGSTRGAAGLLEMTALKTVVAQHSRDRRAYQPTTPEHSRFFAAYLRMAHGHGWKSRFAALREFVRAAGQLK